MFRKRPTMFQILFCLALLFATAQAGFSDCPGCISCDNSGVGWSCKLTQSNGGTSCNTIGGSCIISGNCILPVPADPHEPIGPSYRIELSKEMMQGIREQSPRAAAALDVLRLKGPTQMPVRVFQNPDRHNTAAIVHEIKVLRDPIDGGLILTVRQVGGEELDTFSQLKITVAPQWESDKQWLLVPKLWRRIDQ